MDVKSIIKSIGNLKENLITILLKIQSLKKEKYISHEEIKIISEEMNIPESEILSVLSFYTSLSEKKRGKYIIQVCSSVPCYVNGSVNVLEVLKKELNIDVNETTSDNMFTLEYTSCIGCCKISPAIRIDDKVYGNLDLSIIKDIIEFYREKGGKNE
jgi:NADH-quinone oxidoreductase subunit E